MLLSKSLKWGCLYWTNNIKNDKFTYVFTYKVRGCKILNSIIVKHNELRPPNINLFFDGVFPVMLDCNPIFHS